MPYWCGIGATFWGLLISSLPGDDLSGDLLMSLDLTGLISDFSSITVSARFELSGLKRPCVLLRGAGYAYSDTRAFK